MYTLNFRIKKAATPEKTTGYGFNPLEKIWFYSKLTLAQLNIPAVALLGIHLSSTQRDLLRTWKHVILMLGGDCAGRRATTQIQNSFKLNTKVDTITLAPDHDPDDLTDDQLSSITQYLFP